MDRTTGQRCRRQRHHSRGGSCRRPVSLIDLYPTLVDLCALPPKAHLEGTNLTPLLENPGAPWDRPVIMSHSPGNQAVRSERWRYIRYEDGSEELYDHMWDPFEWTNLAGKPQFTDIKRDLATHLPENCAPHAKRDR